MLCDCSFPGKNHGSCPNIFCSFQDVSIRSCFTFPPWYAFKFHAYHRPKTWCLSTNHQHILGILQSKGHYKHGSYPKGPCLGCRCKNDLLYPKMTFVCHIWVIYESYIYILSICGDQKGSKKSFQWFPHAHFLCMKIFSWLPAAAKKERNPGATIILRWSSCEASMNLEKLTSQIERAKKWKNALELEKWI